VAVERNREIVPKAEYSTTSLAPGDVLEVVEFVGGG
jgi:thiamine biosynthesis protein ThiS